MQGKQVLDGRNNVTDGEHQFGAIGRGVNSQLLVDLVAADLCQVVTLGIEVEVVQQSLSGFNVGGFARTQLAVDIGQRLVAGTNGVLLEGLKKHRVGGEVLANLGLGQAKSLEEVRHRLLTLTVDTHAHGVTLIDFELEPCTTAGDDLRVEDFLIGCAIRGPLEVHARRTDELRDNDALGAVNDEGATGGHEREIAHEDGLRLNFARVVVHELGGHVHGCRVGVILSLRFFNGVLRSFQAVIAERKRHGASHVFNRRDLLENFFKTGDIRNIYASSSLCGIHACFPCIVSQQPVKAFGLQAEQIRCLQRLAELSERNAVLGLVGSVGTCSQRGSFPAFSLRAHAFRPIN